ncbi:OpgC domain-containing protein [Nocardioides bruguierae]|uniref:OpgC domain-containing protein n=1 Tax=Nocardioides bruguierae TaxID=2945102 RepID=UPI002021FEE8|nr:OpgC domain-containing protein [Nocardioides bruguierae]MCL8024389.1 OpgC domain-containing protein [Nocardioides bruguierae]
MPHHLLTRRRLGRAAGILVVVLVLALVVAYVALRITSASDREASVPTDPPAMPASGHAWFGPGLEWGSDSAADYAERLGATPSLYAQRVDYPLTDDDVTYLGQFAEQASGQGAVAVLDVEPTVALRDLTEDDAQLLADELHELHRTRGTRWLVRFGPEMNGSWTLWGQQPGGYVQAFRSLATAVGDDRETARGTLPVVSMVWSPVYGAGYPYGAAYGDVAPSRDATATGLDTTGDGVVDAADDPYGPYWPGEQYVDWVGLTLYHFGVDQQRVDNDLDPATGGTQAGLGEGFEPNVQPARKAFEQRLDDRYGYAADAGTRQTFYQRYAVDRRLPMIVETGALWEPDAEGDNEYDIKSTWWDQVLGSLTDHPRIKAISWLEQRRTEAEVADAVVDWRATRRPALADDLRVSLRRSGADIGPVTTVLDQAGANEAAATTRLPEPETTDDELGWIALCALVLALLLLVASWVARVRPGWAYRLPTGVDGAEDEPVSPGGPVTKTAGIVRDARLDLLRGLLLVALVVVQVEVAGPFTAVTDTALLAISGPELFVLVSGLALGLVTAPTIARLGEWAAAVTTWRRAARIYAAALGTTVVVYLLARIPFVRTDAVTTVTDDGGRVHDLYTGGADLLAYPPPGDEVRRLLLLQLGPWVVSMLGLFVVLGLVTPVLVWLLHRRLWWALLGLSWTAYVLGVLSGATLVGSQFADAYPLLVWQLPFVHGLVLAHHREDVARGLAGAPIRVVAAALALVYGAGLGWLWLQERHGVAGPFPDGTYAWVADHLYDPVLLQPGRLVDLALVGVAALLVLTACWTPVARVLGPVLLPLGRAALTVVVAQAFLAIAVDNVPGLDRDSWWQGLLVHVVVLALVWVLARRRTPAGATAH